MPEDLPDRYARKNVRRYARQIRLERMSEEMQDMPDRTSQDLPARMPGRMSEDMPDRMPEKLSRDMPDRYARKNVRIYVR